MYRALRLVDRTGVLMSQDLVRRETVTVDLENGLHLVPCSRIAQIASGFECDVQVHKDSLTVDAKTILDLMTLNAEFGTSLVLEARGNDGHGLSSHKVLAHEYSCPVHQPQCAAA